MASQLVAEPAGPIGGDPLYARRYELPRPRRFVHGPAETTKACGGECGRCRCIKESSGVQVQPVESIAAGDLNEILNGRCRPDAGSSGLAAADQKRRDPREPLFNFCHHLPVVGDDDKSIDRFLCSAKEIGQRGDDFNATFDLE